MALEVLLVFGVGIHGLYGMTLAEYETLNYHPLPSFCMSTGNKIESDIYIVYRER